MNELVFCLGQTKQQKWDNWVKITGKSEGELSNGAFQNALASGMFSMSRSVQALAAQAFSRKVLVRTEASGGQLDDIEVC